MKMQLRFDHDAPSLGQAILLNGVDFLQGLHPKFDPFFALQLASAVNSDCERFQVVAVAEALLDSPKSPKKIAQDIVIAGSFLATLSNDYRVKLLKEAIYSDVDSLSEVCECMYKDALRQFKRTPSLFVHSPEDVAAAVSLIALGSLAFILHEKSLLADALEEINPSTPDEAIKLLAFLNAQNAQNESKKDVPQTFKGLLMN